MNYLSVCSGIEAASVAFRPIGWEPLAFAEIDSFCSALLKYRYPHTPNLGDFTGIGHEYAGKVDLLVGGTRCQSFSIAGKRHGLDDARGNLTLEFARLADRLRPTWLVWENVPGVLSIDRGRAFGAFLGMLVELGYGFAYRVLDAQYFGVPQRRRRVFVVGYLGDWRPPAAVLLEQSRLSGYLAPRRQAGQDCAPTLSARAHSGGGPGSDFEINGGLISSTGNISHSLNAGGMGRLDYETETLISFDCMAGGNTGFSIGEKAGALRACGASAIQAMKFVRRLTPRECERLQGFPDDYTLIPYRGTLAKDSPRYKSLGNSMAVPVMRWIGERIKRLENAL